MINYLRNKILLLITVIFAFCCCKVEQKMMNLSFSKLIEIDSLTEGNFSARIENMFRIPDDFYYRQISDKNEILKIIKKQYPRSDEKTFVISNFINFSFKIIDNENLSVFYKDTFLTVIDGFDYCYKPYLNAQVIGNYLFFDKEGRSILKKEKLHKNFRKLLYQTYTSDTLNYERQKVENNRYYQRVILEFSTYNGLKYFCANEENIEQMIFNSEIENMCNYFCRKNKLSRIVFCSFVFGKKT
jgi:hypothetical protein